MSWLGKIQSDLTHLPDYFTYVDGALLLARQHCRIHGVVEKNLTELPGHTEVIFNQLQECEAILNYMNIQLRKIRQKHFKKYLEGYAKALTSRDAEKYADAEEEIIDYETLINEVSLLRNRFLGVMKGLDQKSYSLSNLVRLKCAGMEDFNL